MRFTYNWTTGEVRRVEDGPYKNEFEALEALVNSTFDHLIKDRRKRLNEMIYRKTKAFEKGLKCLYQE